jgi:hypothetical protein
MPWPWHRALLGIEQCAQPQGAASCCAGQFAGHSLCAAGLCTLLCSPYLDVLIVPCCQQVFILDSLAAYNTTDPRDAEKIVERVLPRLQHVNSAVVLSAIKVGSSRAGQQDLHWYWHEACTTAATQLC